MMTNTQFLIMSLLILLRMRDVKDKIRRTGLSDIFRSHHQASRILTLGDGTDRNFHYSLRNSPEERSPLYSTADAWNLAKVLKKNQHTHFKFNNFFSRKLCVLWNKVQKYGRAEQATVDNMAMRISRWMTNATNTPSEDVTLIAFSQQQLLHERSSMWRYTHIACLLGTR